MLRFVAWVRRQRLPMLAYAHLPLSWRRRLSAFVRGSTVRPLRFTRTGAWATSASGTRPEFGDALRGSGPGVNIVGYVRGDFGLAESARLYANALIKAGVPVSFFDVDASPVAGRSNHVPVDAVSESLPYGTCFVFVNPDRLRGVLARIGSERLRGKHLVACWFWELERVPDAWLAETLLIDEFLVPSRFIADAIRHATDKPLLKVPQPVCDRADSGLQRPDFGLEEGKFIFLVTFDFNSVYERKNPMGAVRAFTRAFERSRDDVRLLIKSTNGSGYTDSMAQLLEAAASDPRIVVRDDRIDRVHMVALQRCCDAVISLHRAEGFGLGLAECMRMGKPVVATRWSGNIDFMDDGNSCLVDCRLVPVDSSQYPGARDARWADPDIEDAARHMRRLVDEPGFASSLGERAAASIRRSHGDSHAGELIRTRLQQLAETHPGDGTGDFA